MKLTKLDTTTHETLLRIEDRASGLRGFIAVHSTSLGPAIGGTRFRPYATDASAIEDVLHLSQGMTFKTAIADLPLGGGKAVIVGDPARQKSPELLRAYGRAVDTLKGAYWTAEDMGTSTADMEIVAETTRYVTGRARGQYASGDPSAPTSALVVAAIGIAARHQFGSSDLAGRRISIQGLGHVGSRVARLLHAAGADLVLSDTVPGRAADLAGELGAKAVDPEQIYGAQADIFAPCAIGGTLNARSIRALKVRAVVGSANNQLATPEDGRRLKDRGILYGPDYVVNAGGVINAAAEVLRVQDRGDWVEAKLDAMRVLLDTVFSRAISQGVRPERIADEIVAARLEGGSDGPRRQSRRN